MTPTSTAIDNHWLRRRPATSGAGSTRSSSIHTHAGLDRMRSIGSVGATMNEVSRNTKRVLAAVTVALVLAGCGGGSRDDDSAGIASPAASTDVAGAELAGVHFDVRRDPG